jgi:hypothetical protein
VENLLPISFGDGLKVGIENDSKNNMAGGILGTPLFSVPLKAWGLKRIPP